MNIKNFGMKKGGGWFVLLVALLMAAPFIGYAAELKIWNKSGSDEIISLKGNRPYIKCSSTTGNTRLFYVDKAGNVAIYGNLVVQGTFTNGVTSDYTFDTMEVTYDLTVGDSGRMGTSLMVGTTSTFSGAVSALAAGLFGTTLRSGTALTVGTTTTSSGAVLGVTTGRFGTGLIVGTTTAISGAVTGSTSGAFGTTLNAGTTLRAGTTLTVGTSSAFSGAAVFSGLLTAETLVITNDAEFGTTARTGTDLMVGGSTTSSGEILGIAAARFGTLIVGGATSISGAVDTGGAIRAGTSLMVGTTTTSSGAVLGSTTGRFGTTLTVGTTTTSSGAVLGLTTGRFGTTLTVGTTTASSGKVTMLAGSVSILTPTVIAAAQTTALSASQVAGGFIKLAGTSVVTFAATSATGNAGQRVLCSHTDATACVIFVENGIGNLGASFDTLTFGTSIGACEFYCDGTYFWLISQRDVTIN